MGKIFSVLENTQKIYKMLKTRVIPILTINGSMQVVKTVNFKRPARIVGNLMQYIKIFERRNLDELVIIDIDATLENRLIDCNKIKEYTKELYCPLTLGGGIKTLDDINKLLQSGADKVCINTAILNNLYLAKAASNKFGSQSIIGAINTTNIDMINWICEGKELFDTCGLGGCAAYSYASKLSYYGCGEILLTSIDKEGTYNGYDLDCISEVSKSVSIPIISNGGCGSVAHASQALKAGAHAVAASSIFLFTEMTPKIMSEELNNLGHRTRV